MYDNVLIYNKSNRYRYVTYLSTKLLVARLNQGISNSMSLSTAYYNALQSGFQVMNSNQVFLATSIKTTSHLGDAGLKVLTRRVL